ncbi:uncharacterized protein [Acropora muricata]|uniref:uncharacterized protein n=1 Tax=Acropora muricata TaxID=159855 RepID=UPI0034E554B9
MEELNEKDLSWCEDNLKKGNPESKEQQKKRKRSEKKTSSGKAAKQSKASKAKKACTVIVAGEPSTETANYTEEKDCSYNEVEAVVSIPVPASPSISDRTSPPPTFASPQAFRSG